MNQIKNAVKVGRQALQDPKILAQVVLGIIVLLVSWSGVKVIQTNYGLQKQVATLKSQNQVANLENQNQQLMNNYYNSTEFQQIVARQELGLGNSGETELIVPKSVAYSHLNPQIILTGQSTTSKSKAAPWYQRNWRAWRDFFLDKPASY